MYEKDYYEGNMYERVDDVALYEGLEAVNESLSGIYEVLLQLLKAVEKGEKQGFKVGAEMEKDKESVEGLVSKIFGN